MIEEEFAKIYRLIQHLTESAQMASAVDETAAIVGFEARKAAEAWERQADRLKHPIPVKSIEDEIDPLGQG